MLLMVKPCLSSSSLRAMRKNWICLYNCTRTSYSSAMQGR